VLTIIVSRLLDHYGGLEEPTRPNEQALVELSALASGTDNEGIGDEDR